MRSLTNAGVSKTSSLAGREQSIVILTGTTFLALDDFCCDPTCKELAESTEEKDDRRRNEVISESQQFDPRKWTKVVSIAV